MIDELTQAFQAHNWYAVAAIVLGTLIFAARKMAPKIWRKIPRGWRWLPPLLLSAAAGFVDAYQSGKAVSAALWAAMAAVFYVGLPASGAHGWIRELGARKKRRNWDTDPAPPMVPKPPALPQDIA